MIVAATPLRPVSALERIEIAVQIDTFIGQTQLVSRRTAVLFNGVKGDVEQAGNLFVGQAVFDEVADFGLTGSQFHSDVGYFLAQGGSAGRPAVSGRGCLLRVGGE